MQRWCRAFMKVDFHIGVTTNNGVEALNNSLKHAYLKLSGTGTLSSMVEAVVQDFVPHLILEYIHANYAYSSQYKMYNTRIPSYLHDRPRNVVKACMIRYESARYCNSDDISEVAPGTFCVPSESDGAVEYSVSVGNDTAYPSCECTDFNSTYLPCKHMFALFRNGKAQWHSLSPLYRENPYLKLDESVLSEGVLIAEKIDCGAEESALQAPVAEPYSPRNAIPVIDTLGDNLDQTIDDTAGLAAARTILKGNIKTLQDMIYLCPKVVPLKRASHTIEEVINELKVHLITEENLPIHPDKILEKTSRTSTRSLPIRKKRKKVKGKRYNLTATDLNKINMPGTRNMCSSVNGSNH